jgi:transcriptional regulator with XRE-family HTH domain
VCEIDESLGAAIRSRRLAMGMSQVTLAKKIGVTFQQIQKYEKGANRISARRLYGIANILQITVDDCFDFRSARSGGLERADSR